MSDYRRGDRVTCAGCGRPIALRFHPNDHVAGLVVRRHPGDRKLGYDSFGRFCSGSYMNPCGPVISDAWGAIGR